MELLRPFTVEPFLLKAQPFLLLVLREPFLLPNRPLAVLREPFLLGSQAGQIHGMKSGTKKESRTIHPTIGTGRTGATGAGEVGDQTD